MIYYDKIKEDKTPYPLRKFGNKIPKLWVNYIWHYLMNKSLWTHYFLWEAHQVLELLEDVDLKGLQILEPGCGNGIVGCLLSLMGAKVTLLDYSDEVLNIAKKHAGMLGLENNIRYIKGDLFKMAYDHEFDLVWNDGVIEHFEHPGQAVKTMIKAAKIGGRVLVTVPAKYTLHTYIIRPYLRARGQFLCDRWGREKSFSEEDMKKLLINSGLGNVKVITSNLRRAFLDDTLILPMLRGNAMKTVFGYCLFNIFDIIEIRFPFLSKAGFIVAGAGVVQ